MAGMLGLTAASWSCVSGGRTSLMLHYFDRLAGCSKRASLPDQA